MNRVSHFCWLLLVFIGNASRAVAQETDITANPDDLIKRLESIFSNLGENIGSFVLGLLFMLLAVDLVFTFGRMITTGGDLGEALYAFVRRLMIAVLVMFVVQNSGPLINSLVDVALRVAGAATEDGTAPDPSVSNILFTGAKLALGVMELTELTSPTTWAFVFIGVFQLIITAVSAFIIIAAYAELYALAPAGLIMLGFSGLKQTEGSGFAYFRTVIGAAVKLMAVLVIYTFLMQLTFELGTEDLNGLEGSAIWQQLLIMFMIQIITPVMMATLPNQVAQMISPISAYGATEMAGRKAGSMGTSAMGTTAKVAGIGAVVAGAAGGGAVMGAIKGGIATAKAKKGGAEIASSAAKAAGSQALSSGMKYGGALKKALGRSRFR